MSPNTYGFILLGIDELTPAEFSAEAEKAGLIILVHDDFISREVLTAGQLDGKYTVIFASNHHKNNKASEPVYPVHTPPRPAARQMKGEGRNPRTFPGKEEKKKKKPAQYEIAEGRTDR